MIEHYYTQYLSFLLTKEKDTGLGLMVSFNIIKTLKGQNFLKK